MGQPEGQDPVEATTTAWARERPGISVEGIGLVTRLWHVAKLCGDQRRRVISEHGADQATLDLLATLRRSGEPYELSPGEIARRTRVTAGAISQRLTRAERDGLVERTRTPGSRERTVRLLPAGHALVDKLVDQIAALDDDLLHALDSAQRQDLDDVLRILLTDVERRYGRQPVTQVGQPG